MGILVNAKRRGRGSRRTWLTRPVAFKQLLQSSFATAPSAVQQVGTGKLGLGNTQLSCSWCPRSSKLLFDGLDGVMHRDATFPALPFGPRVAANCGLSILLSVFLPSGRDK